MTKFISKMIAVICLLFCILAIDGCTTRTNDVVRIHIRANSNSEVDQNIKLKVRDSVVDYITPIIASADNCVEVKRVLQTNINNIKNVANNVLLDNGFEYGVGIRFKNEYFPTRKYGDVVYSADYYDALIIELGCGVGDNWWCVAYPPLCFVGEDMKTNNIIYKSKLVEIIDKYFKR